ncbi:bifunctional tetrahydrofolate synthase/dihydrofolate synthase [Pseudomonas sp. TTU2014-080ASC]|uniref:bifunctional tetrahydrofolate synthase/dihydrofolate synthase n=1 Tax=Pseudomonas sp. TTU2014-080ASC TaxID=1729724 RepID=UPI000718341D|nr:bifunctional tetrahydrofolate synthase/dihydrofolate synthase [Pseudomonas sp. TTU2014-080ASC]KRW59527.1 bifunctional folylpolyglutamate synthase/dihydrofolate synthase [Pseudomonas sp. TTU2014-080ASC]
MSQRSLAEWLTYLEQLHPSAIDMGLERSKAVLDRLNLGAVAPRVVTVTGTNGKGSTCAFIASLLSSQGMTVGVYSSPHLLRYNERVQINGIEASDAELCEAFAAIEAARGDISLTYFEMGTLAAFWLFKRAALDALVLEVGLGGRLDAVNLLDADVAVVTSIGVDHSDWLGDTRESVAFEKAGIFRANKPVVCGDLQPPQPLLARAEVLNAPLFVRGCEFDLRLGGQSWSWQGRTLRGEHLTLDQLPLLDLPMENAAVALQAYAMLDLSWQPQVIAQALQRTRVIGRLDRRSVTWAGKKLTLLLDVGHNPHAATYLAQRLAARPLTHKRRAVFALLSDKDLLGVVQPLLGQVEDWAVAPLPTSRTRQASELQACLQALGASVEAYDSVSVALEAQLNRAADEDEVLLFGSFYCVAEALEWLSHKADGGVQDGFAG